MSSQPDSPQRVVEQFQRGRPKRRNAREQGRISVRALEAMLGSIAALGIVTYRALDRYDKTIIMGCAMVDFPVGGICRSTRIATPWVGKDVDSAKVITCGADVHLSLYAIGLRGHGSGYAC